MNQFDVIDAKSPLRGIPCPKYWDLSSKLGIIERNLRGSDPIIGNQVPAFPNAIADNAGAGWHCADFPTLAYRLEG